MLILLGGLNVVSVGSHKGSGKLGKEGNKGTFVYMPEPPGLMLIVR